MPNYKIFQCPRCKQPLYSPDKQKTKQCPKCQKTIPLNRQKILKITSSIHDAIVIVQNLNLSPALRKQIAQSQENTAKSKSRKDELWEIIIKLQNESENKVVNQVFFLNAAKQQGFAEDWILKQLIELEKEGLLFRPKEGYFQLLI